MLTFWALAVTAELSNQSSDIRPLLRAQGFEWTLEKSDSQIEHIGDIGGVRKTYSIYLYNAVNRETGHGVNLFIYVLNKATFLGVHEAGSAHECRIQKNAVICKSDYPGRRIQFTRDGPPLMLWFDGYYERLWVAPNFQHESKSEPDYEAVRTVLAQHDPHGRLPDTTIQQLGIVRVGTTTYSIYYLDFSNPVSLHGMQQIAIIRNGTEFAGAYLCTLGPDDGQLIIGKDRLTVKIFGMTFVIRFDEKGPTRNKYFCGEGSGWQNEI